MTDLAALWASVPQLSNIHASADGAWAFWCLAGPDETENVWCAPLDGSTPPERVRASGQLIPGSRYAEIDGAGHLPCVEAAPEYAAILNAFLKEVGHA